MKHLNYYFRVDKNGNPVPGSLQRFEVKPINGRWQQLNTNNICCEPEIPDPCPECPECPDPEPEPNFAFTVNLNIGDLFVYNTSIGDENDAKFFTEDGEPLIYTEEGNTLLLQRSNATSTASVRQYDLDGIILGTETVWPTTQTQFNLVLAPGAIRFEIDGG